MPRCFFSFVVVVRLPIRIQALANWRFLLSYRSHGGAGTHAIRITNAQSFYTPQHGNGRQQVLWQKRRYVHAENPTRDQHGEIRLDEVPSGWQLGGSLVRRRQRQSLDAHRGARRLVCGFQRSGVEASTSRLTARPRCLRRGRSRLQRDNGRRKPGTGGSGEFFFRSIIVILDELPDQVRTLFGINSEHSELDEFVGLNLAGPGGSDDVSLVILLEVDLPARLEFEIIDLQPYRKLALDFARADLLFVGYSHGVLLSRAKRGVRREDSNMCACELSADQCGDDRCQQSFHA